ncbi:MAG: 16S rRNA (adenine(1518)-N(6)/adenine(1519)-N(6))-dimethyltransferase RsmA, partial [Chloroflexi bacterium]|nr:16S rRNA (adenine(1518)-N(6)/adenine(1519)-N(6))-dimethyltransferase RsmA [Chloroflexota bacterium]
PQIAARLNPGSFWPSPGVESSVVRIDVYPTSPYTVPDEALFFRVVRAGFGQKRKQLHNSLSAGLSLNKPQVDNLLAQAHIDPQRRAETLNLHEWAALTRAVAAAE